MAKVVKVERQTPFVSLTLEISYEEARVLQALLNRTGGDPAFTRRVHADSVSRAIRQELPYDGALDCTGSLHFARS